MDSVLAVLLIVAGLAAGWIVFALVESRRRQSEFDDAFVSSALRLLRDDHEPISPPVSPRVRLSNDVPTLHLLAEDYPLNDPSCAPAVIDGHEALPQRGCLSSTELQSVKGQ